jgi:hypothetical protein
MLREALLPLAIDRRLVRQERRSAAAKGSDQT